MLTLTMFSVLTRFLGFLYKIYLSRIMTTTELGIYNVTLSVFMVLVTIVGSSIPLTISKITSINKTNNKQYLTHFSITSSLILNTCISILLVFVILIFKPLLVTVLGGITGYNILLVLIPSIIFSAIYAQIRGYLWGMENYFAVSIVEFIEQILRIVFCMIFVTLNIFSSPIISIGVALSFACGLSTLYGFVLYFKYGGKIKYKQGYYKDIIKSSMPLTLVRLFSSLLQPIVAVILPIQLTLLGMEKTLALSELGIIMGMSLPLLSIPSTIIGALCMILIPRISSCEDDTQNKLTIQIDNYINFSIMCLFMFLPIFITLGIPICTFIFENVPAGIYLSFSAWIIIPMGLSQITSSILNALNQEKKSFLYYMLSSIFMVLAVLILPRFVGTTAMTIGMGISMTILAILNIRKIRSITNYNSSIINKLIIQLLLNLPIILITKLTFNWLSLILSDFFVIAISCIICCLSYIGLLFVFNIIDFKIIKNLFNKTLKKS